MQRIAFAVALATLALSAAGLPSFAHQAPSGWTYEYACCGGNDCAPVRPEQVRVTRAGYVVTVPPGSHPQVGPDAHTLTVTIPYDGVKPSQDGDYHLCLSASDKRVLCFYAPPGGV